MAEAAYAAGPTLLGALRLLSSIFPNFCFLFQHRAQCKLCTIAGPQRAQVPQNLKSEAPKSGAPNFFCFLFQCLSVGPHAKSPRSPENVRPQNLKI
jgi:hypothetical protein